MKLSDLRVGARLRIGFALLLLFSLVIGGIALSRLSHLDSVVNRMSTEDWEKARIAMENQIRTREANPDIDLHLVDRCGHLVMWDAPEALTTLAATFLAE